MIRRLTCVVYFALATPSFAGEVEPLFDFEQPGLGDSWSAVGKIEAARKEVAADAPKEGPAGFGVQLKSAGQGGLFSKPGKLPADLTSGLEVELWIHRSEAEAKLHPTSAIEIQFLEEDGQAKFFHKVDLAHTGWKKIEIPLKHFRWSDHRIPRWARVQRLGVWFRDAGELQVDEVAIERGEDANASELQANDLARIAFPDRMAKEIQISDKPTRLLLTDYADFDLTAFNDHLDKVEAAVLKDFPFLEESLLPATLIVFAKEDDYRAFPPRLATLLNGSAAKPASGGFTLQGIATSFWTGDKPRPVFTHEYVHSFLSVRANLNNRGEWLQEGLANYYQLKFHPQDLRMIIAQGIADPKFRLPLEELTSGKTVPTNSYWQAVTVVDLLLNDDKYRGKLKEFLTAVQKSESTDLAPHLKPVFQTDMAGFTADWQKHAQKMADGK